MKQGGTSRGFRGGWYTAVGMSGFGVILAMVHCIIDMRKVKKRNQEVAIDIRANEGKQRTHEKSRTIN